MSDDGSQSSGYGPEQNPNLNEDPWDVKPFFCDKPPQDTTSYCLHDGERLLFYQRSRFPIHAYLGHTESEVAITQRRIFITQCDQLRSPHGHGLTYRRRQHVTTREKVSGYEAGVVQPRCCHLFAGIFMFLVGFWFVVLGRDGIWIALRWLNPYIAIRLFGGHECRRLGWCAFRGTNSAMGSPVDDAQQVMLKRGIVGNALIQHTATTRFHTESPVWQRSQNRLDANQMFASPSALLEMRPSGSLVLTGASSSNRDRHDRDRNFAAAYRDLKMARDQKGQVLPLLFAMVLSTNVEGHLAHEASIDDSKEQHSELARSDTIAAIHASHVSDGVAQHAEVPHGAVSDIKAQSHALSISHSELTHAEAESQVSSISDVVKQHGEVTHAAGSISDSEEQHGCENFPNWRDNESQDCDRYAGGEDSGSWRLSCSAGASSSESEYLGKQFEAMRTQNNAMHLSPLEACCACGGGKTLGFNLGVKRIVAALWPLLLAASGASEGKTSQRATRLVLVGRASLLDAFSDFSLERLEEVGRLLALIPTGEVVAGILAIPEPLSQLLEQLSEESRIKSVADGLGTQPIPGVTRNALNLDLEDAEGSNLSQSEISRYAWWSYVQPILVCALQAINFILMAFGIHLCVQWLLDQKYHMDRLYVVLKVHQDHFGPAKNLRVWKPFVKQWHKVEHVIGFYLPPASISPYCLREMSNALLLPSATQFEQAEGDPSSTALAKHSEATSRSVSERNAFAPDTKRNSNMRGDGVLPHERKTVASYLRRQINGETEEALAHLQTIKEATADTSVDQPWQMDTSLVGRDTYVKLVTAFWFFIKAILLLFPLCVVQLPFILALWLYVACMPTPCETPHRISIAFRFYLVCCFLVGSPMLVIALMSYLLDLIMYYSFSIIFCLVRCGWSNYFKSVAFIAPYQNGPLLLFCWSDVVTALMGQVWRQGFWESTFKLANMWLFIPWVKYFINTNPFIYNLEERFVQQITTSMQDMPIAAVLRALFRIISRTKQADDLQDRVDSWKFAPHYPYPPPWKRWAIGCQAGGNAEDLPISFFLFVHVTHALANHCGSTEQFVASNSAVAPGYRVMLWYNNPYHIFTGWVEASISSGQLSQPDKNRGGEHPMWLLTSRSPLLSARESICGCGAIDNFFDRWLPTIVDEIRFLNIGETAAQELHEEVISKDGFSRPAQGKTVPLVDMGDTSSAFYSNESKNLPVFWPEDMDQ